MQLRPLGSNQNEIELTDGTRVLFSYRTPVAVYVPGAGYFRTSDYHSKTTSKHINQWLDGATAAKIAQSELDKFTA
jgi:hypothetical protein